MPAAPAVGRAAARGARGGGVPAGPHLRPGPAGPHRPPARRRAGSRPWRWATARGGPSGTNGWLAGFWPGRLWLAYELDGRPALGPAGDRHGGAAGRPAGRHHSARPRLPDPDQLRSRRRPWWAPAATPGVDPARAAAALASRYVPAAGVIRCWAGAGRPGRRHRRQPDEPRAAVLGRRPRRPAPSGGTSPLQHALTTARWHLRADGSTFQVVRFDESTGQPVWAGTAQGLSDTSTWARGQAWAVHGFTTAYRRDRRPAAAGRGPQGRRLRRRRTRRPTACRGGTTTRPAPGATRRPRPCRHPACSSWPGSTRTPDRRATWRAAGLHTLRSLVGPAYLARGTGAWSVLLHGRHDPTYDDAGVTYGDYYLLEALLRVQLLPSDRPALPVASTRRGAGGGLRADLGSRRRVSAVSVRWAAGASTATRYRVQTSVDGRRWTTVRGGVSSGRTALVRDLRPAGPGHPVRPGRAAGHEHRCARPGRPAAGPRLTGRVSGGASWAS